MTKNLLALLGLIVVVHCGHQHYVKYQRMKREIEYLHRRWKECLRGDIPPHA